MQKNINDDSLVRYQKIIIDVINKYLPNCIVYLFGSRARKTDRQGSDIDIAVDAGSPIDHRFIAFIREDLEESRLPVFVDIVDVHSASDRIVQQIKKDGIIWKQ